MSISRSAAAQCVSFDFWSMSSRCLSWCNSIVMCMEQLDTHARAQFSSKNIYTYAGQLWYTRRTEQILWFVLLNLICYRTTNRFLFIVSGKLQTYFFWIIKTKYNVCQQTYNFNLFSTDHYPMQCFKQSSQSRLNVDFLKIIILCLLRRTWPMAWFVRQIRESNGKSDSFPQHICEPN